ncbi:MAG: TIGR02757 family protein [Bacteroidales bacterium]|jgi:uncharacterized protein (TIGR02757 family)|nr:TIGR02757 family protein [Bacteroidales bacterium]
MDKGEALKTLLDERYRLYCTPQFVLTDPVQAPHRYTRKEDIEIAGFLAASIAWGQRKSIINNANRLMQLMNDTPYQFVMNAGREELQRLDGFVHRTFQPDDCLFFITALRHIYTNCGGLQTVFAQGFSDTVSIFGALTHFRRVFMTTPHLPRSGKHVSDVERGAAAKRLNMFLRWMVRRNDGVDFGLWQDIPPAALMIPLDVHTGNVSRRLGLLNRKANDWKAVEELTANLRRFDSADPVKYDFALFGMGAMENNG